MVFEKGITYKSILIVIISLIFAENKPNITIDSLDWNVGTKRDDCRKWKAAKIRRKREEK